MDERQQAMQKYHEEWLQSRNTPWQNPYGVNR
mgnify:FL=1